MKVKINRIHISCIVCICIMFLVVFHTNEINAQTQVYPVSVTTQISPPYSVNLSDYAAPGSEQMKVIVLQRDLTQSQYQLYLKMQIELNGRIIVRTSPTYIPPAFVLEPGIPTLISGSSLSPYFDPANMEFTGYSRDQYMRTKLFPEGAYIITFTAFDWTRRDVALSNGGAFYCYLAKTDPPILNLPINNALVQHSSPQYINFQWLSRNLSSPNSAFSTRYKFELFEMRVGGISPSEVVTRTRSIFSAETDRTNLTYSIAEPVLEKGMRYVWRVKAFDTQGKDYIRNNGFSEVFSFVYGEGETGVVDFSAVGNFKAQAVSPRKAKLTWDVSSAYDSYRIYYRKQGNANKWYESESVKNNTEINGLSPGSIYECKVQGKRGNAWGSFSTMDTVGMPLLPVIECGSPFTPLEVANREPLLELMHLQEFDAGGFMVTIADPYALTTSPGRFTGKGFVQVPLFGHKKIRCEFTNIFINTDFRMVEGSIRLITDTNDGKNALWNIDEVFEGGSENGTVIDGTEEVSLIIPDIVITDAGSLMLDTASDEIFVLDELQDTTVRIDVSIKLSENPGTLTIQDSQGNLYSVDTKSGKATSLGKILPSGGAQQLATLPSVVDTRKGKVIFEPIPGQTRFAFDVRSQKYARSNIFSQEYKTMNTEDGGLYDIPYKLIPAGETDVVLARVDLKNKSIKADSIVFRSGTGTVYKTQSSGKTGEYLLTLPSGKANDGIEVSATYTDSKGRVFVLGRLIVMSYEYRKPELVLVPVNGNGTDTDPATIKEMLDKVYLPVAVDWQVSLESNFESKVDSLDIKGSGMFSMYTDGMKALNNAFIVHKGQAFDPSAVYLFLLQVSGEESATGDMPRSKQFGYVFTRTAGSSEAINRTIAHEIAHGAFSLSHTFDSKYDIDQGTTSNLLDYTAGTDLVKHQWDAIHNPGLVVGMFERDEEGMLLNCFAPKPAKPGIYEGQREIVKVQMTSSAGLSTMTQECTEIFYYHIEDHPYNSCCDENGKELLVISEYKSDWYTEKDYCFKVLRHVLESFGILNGQITGLSSNQDTRKISACYNLEQFFKDRQVDENFSMVFETPYFYQICNDAKDRFSGSGGLERVNLELDVALALSPIRQIRAIFSYLRARSFLKGTRLFVSKTGKSIEILSKEGGEKVAAFSDDLFKEINFIDEGGEVMGSLGKVKYIDKDGNQIENIIEIIRKDGQIGLRKGTNVIQKTFKLGDEISGISIKQIKHGSNGKIAVIGRSMGNTNSKGVRDVYQELLNQGYSVEIFDNSSLTGEWLDKFNKAINQFEAATNGWTKRLTNEELMQLDIYKLNKEWAEMLKEKGYIVFDIGDFNNQGFSVFYALEKSIIFK